MDTLPFEVLSEIASHLSELDNSRIAKYAPISRAWQQVIERVTFRSLRVSNYDLEHLDSLFKENGVHRCGFVSRLTVHLYTAPFRDGCCYVEKLPPVDDEIRQVSTAMAQLFSIIKALEKGSSRADPSLSLILIPETWENGGFEHMFDNDPILDNKNECPYDNEDHTMSAMLRFLQGRMLVDLIDSEVDLPELQNVKELRIYDGGMIGSLPALMRKVLGKLPNVTRVYLPSRERYSHGRLGRIKFRKEFADAASFISNASLEEIELRVGNPDPLGHEYAPVPRLVEENATEQDAYTRTLRSWSVLPALTKLHIKGKTAICPDIFQNLNKQAESTFFPNLRDFYLEFMLETADGRWFFLPTEKTMESTGDADDPIYDDYDGWAMYGDGPLCRRRAERCLLRSNPDPELFLPFLRSAGESASKMPQLRRFTLVIDMEEEMTDEDDTLRYFRFWMLKPGVRYFDEAMRIPQDETLVHLPRLYWRITDWTPGELELAAWKSAAGPDTVVCLLNTDEDYWDIENQPRVEVYNADLEPL